MTRAGRTVALAAALAIVSSAWAAGEADPTGATDCSQSVPAGRAARFDKQTVAPVPPDTRASHAAPPRVFPGKTWQERPPAEVGLNPGRLRSLAAFLGGRGCVIRHGYLVYTWGDASKRGDVASAAKPVYAHFLLKAVEDGKIPGLDEPIVRLQPGLADLNADLGHKDRGITWRHLANQTSCYGLAEMAVASPLANRVPQSAGRQAAMMPGQRSIGSRRIPDNQTDHLGSYSWLWWTNGMDREGRRHWPDAPTDTFGAFGHSGKRAMVVLPGPDLIVAWNDSRRSGRDDENAALGRLVASVTSP